MNDAGALSVEDAVTHLATEEAAEDQPNTIDIDDIDDIEPDAAPDDDDAPDDVDDDDTQPQAAEDPAQPAIDPPKSWDADHRDKWSGLPRDMQEYLSKREAERDQGVSVAQQRAAEARQRAEAEAQTVTAFKPQLEGLITQAQAQLDRWSGMDATAWQQLAQTDPNRYVALKAQHDADVQRVQQIDTARQQAEVIEYSTFTQSQSARLPEIAPHLASDQKAQAEVFDYIGKSVPNITPEQRRWVSADEFLIAWKAMQYDKAQAPKPQVEGRKVPTVRPGTPPTPQKQRNRAQSEAAFAKAPTVENAIKLLS